jgi:hypothetical protein
MTIATWHARTRALEAVAVLANAAADASARAPSCDYARAYAAELDRIRTRLVATAREAEPPAPAGWTEGSNVR